MHICGSRKMEQHAIQLSILYDKVEVILNRA